MRNVPVTILLQRERWIKLGAFFTLLAAIGFTIFLINNLLISFLIAFVLSYLLQPMVNFLEGLGWSRLRSITFIFLVLGGLLSITSSLLFPLLADQIEAINANMPTYIDGTTKIIAHIEKRLEFLTGMGLTLNVQTLVRDFLKSNMEQLLVDSPQLIKNYLTTTILAPFFAFFMLKDGRDIGRRMTDMVPNSVFELTLNLQYQINQQIGSFIRARLLEALIVGLVTWIGLALINAPYALILSLIAAITNLIPYVGPLIGAAPAFVIYIINGASTVDIVLVTMVYAFAQILDVVVLIPMMVAKLVNLHPVVVVLALIIGAQLLGILGMLIAIPLASALKVTVVTVYDHILDFRT